MLFCISSVMLLIIWQGLTSRISKWYHSKVICTLHKCCRLSRRRFPLPSILSWKKQLPLKHVITSRYLNLDSIFIILLHWLITVMCSASASVVNCECGQMFAQKGHHSIYFIWLDFMWSYSGRQNWYIVCPYAFCRDASAQKCFCFSACISLGTLDGTYYWEPFSS